MVLAGAAVPALAAHYSIELNSANTKIEFTLGDVLHTVHGTFALRSGTIDFDPDSGAASGRVVIDVASGNSGSEARDHRMHKNVLESAKYPEATFVPDSVEGKVAIPGQSSIKLHGMLTIHGAAHEITMNVEEKSTSSVMDATVRFEIPYVAWGMKDPSNFMLRVNKTVQVSMQTNASLVTH
jgi:polyisoprenoid-binding protein YceI